MRLIPSAVLFAITAGCDSGSFQGELKPCPCADGGCSEEACPIEVAIDPGCEGQFELAEVLIGDHVESAAVRPSEQLAMCSAIEPSSTVTIFVRGGDWAWGPLEERCETPRETRVVRLQCVESP
jgi:hypothetical protein